MISEKPAQPQGETQVNKTTKPNTHMGQRRWLAAGLLCLIVISLFGVLISFSSILDGTLLYAYQLIFRLPSNDPTMARKLLGIFCMLGTFIFATSMAGMVCILIWFRYASIQICFKSMWNLFVLIFERFRILNDSAFYYTISVFLLSLFLINAKGTGDVKYFVKVMEDCLQYGLRIGYENEVLGYPPLGHAILWVFGGIGTKITNNTFIIYKTSLLFFLMLSFFVYYQITRDIRITLWGALSLIISSVGLGYMDIYTVPFILASYKLLKERHLALSLFLLTVACLIKPLPWIIAPFFVIYWINGFLQGNYSDRKVSMKKIIFCALPSMLIVFAAISYVNVAFLKALNQAMSHSMLSANALNINWVIQYFLLVFSGKIAMGQMVTYKEFLPGSTLFYIPKYVFILTYILLVIGFVKQRKTYLALLVYSMIAYGTFCMINLGVHENHWFPLLLISALAWNEDKTLRDLFLLSSIFLNVNLYVFYGVDGNGMGFNRSIMGIDIAVLFAFANIVTFVFFIKNAATALRNENQACRLLPIRL